MPTFKEHIIKTAGGYKLVSKKTGKNLGTATTKAGIEKRERQVQYFKHMHEDKRMLSFKEFVREDESPITHHVVHIKTGNIVGKYTGLKAAQRAADKKKMAWVLALYHQDQQTQLVVVKLQEWDNLQEASLVNQVCIFLEKKKKIR